MKSNSITSSKDQTNYVRNYKNEFITGANGMLHCILCNKNINCSRKFTVDKHRNSKKHAVALLSIGSKQYSKQTFLTDTNKDFTEKVVDAFLSADIPLYKLRNPKLKALLTENNNQSISESKARKYVETVFDKQSLNLIEYFKNEKIFIVIDESEIKKKKYFNVLAGRIEKPKKILVVDCVELEDNINSIIVKNQIKEALERINVEFKNLSIIISDRASYMIKAVADIKSTYGHVFHVHCLAHLIHNCAMKIRSYFKDIDSLIGSFKMLTHKNKNIQSLFVSIAIPPSVIITRWSSWLRAAIYYSDNLPTIYNIFKNIKPEGILYQRAYEALHNPTVYPNLITIKRSYSFLINILDMFENEGLTINTGYEEVDKIKIQEDPVELMHYVQACIEKNDIKSITLIRNTLISPSDYCFLQDCPPTSITVERSFSMLKKLLAVDRNFNKENIIKYFMVYFNVSASNDKQLENIEEFSDNQIE